MIDSIRFLKLHEDAILPTRGSEKAAGLDLYSIESITLGPGERAAVRTGLAVAIPEGFYGRIGPRSGLAVKHGIDTLAGIVDCDYRGQILCALINLGQETVTLEKGERIAQLIIEAIITPQPAWAENLDETTRGAGGFGSTGRG
jgi:dUTP pyrophosphatase